MIEENATPLVHAQQKPEVWDVSLADYHSDAPHSISHSEAELFLTDPGQYYRRFVTKEAKFKRSKTLDIGSLFHDVVLGLPYECDSRNYRHHTIAMWRYLESEPDSESDSVSESGSRYWLDSFGVVRASDHWGRVGSCYWELDGMKCEHEAGVGYCEWDRFLYDTGDFAPIPRDVLNGDGHCKGKAWTEWEREHKSLPMLKGTDGESGWSIIPEMVAAIRKHDAANTVLFELQGQNEIGMRVRHDPTGLLIRCRVDAYRPGVVIGDLKSIRYAHCHPKAFSEQSYSLGYHRQAAWYQDIVAAVTGEVLPFTFIVVDKTSYRVEAFEMAESFIQIGREQNNRILHRMAECYRSGRFVSPTHGRIVTVSAPRWANYEREWEFTE